MMNRTRDTRKRYTHFSASNIPTTIISLRLRDGDNLLQRLVASFCLQLFCFLLIPHWKGLLWRASDCFRFFSTFLFSLLSRGGPLPPQETTRTLHGFTLRSFPRRSKVSRNGGVSCHAASAQRVDTEFPLSPVLVPDAMRSWSSSWSDGRAGLFSWI
jgi:hypothetical protein